MPYKADQNHVLIETERLIIRKAETSEADINIYYSLWTNPRVMTNVGFPNGLRITREEISIQIAGQDPSEFDALLVIALKRTNEPIGECKLGWPDDKACSATDIKLLPGHWGNGYGVEIKEALVDYLFIHTDCAAVKATPNKSNIASQKMQEAVGGKRVGEEVYRFPEHMRDYTCDVPHYVYMIFRGDWEKRQGTE
jgi:RimJ/RimL family protein N-acetyltransferase